jgi:hypothetical protein
MRVRAAQIAVQRQDPRVSSRLGDREADAQDRVRAQVGLVVTSVEGAQGGIDGALIGGVHADGLRRKHAVDVVDGPRDALAAITVAAIAQLDRLELAGRGTAWHRGTAERAIDQHTINLDRRVTARVE